MPRLAIGNGWQQTGFFLKIRDLVDAVDGNQNALLSCGLSFKAVPMPTSMPSCIVRSLKKGFSEDSLEKAFFINQTSES